MEERSIFSRLIVLAALACASSGSDPQAGPGTKTKSARRLDRISNDLSYTVYSDEIESGFKSYSLDASEARIALAWKKMAKKSNKRHHPRRAAREIYGHDTRSLVLSPVQKRMFPFNTVARVYPGCSGTVIGRRHILTAADCLHDGNRLLTGVDKLRVALYDQDVDYDPHEGRRDPAAATHRYPVDKVFVPNGWRWRLDQDRYNYAVVRVSGARFNSCMAVEGNADGAVTSRSRIHFSSYERLSRKEEPLLMYRYCRMEHNSVTYIYERCDATAEARGAGLYFRFWKGAQKTWDRKIIAVKSDKQQFIGEEGGDGKSKVAVGKDLRITPLVFAQICFWVSDNPLSCGKGIISNPCLKDNAQNDMAHD